LFTLFAGLGQSVTNPGASGKAGQLLDEPVFGLVRLQCNLPGNSGLDPPVSSIFADKILTVKDRHSPGLYGKSAHFDFAIIFINATIVGKSFRPTQFRDPVS
jgi:hypothetical protein